MIFNYINLDKTYEYYLKLKPLKLFSTLNLYKNINLANMKEKLQPFYISVKDIINKYADKNEKGEVKLDSENRYTIPPEKIKEYNNEIFPLYNEKVEVNITIINLSDIDKAMQAQSDFVLDWDENEILMLKNVVNFEG